MAKRCFLKCMGNPASHSPIPLGHQESVIIGRSALTKITDKRCSRNQLELQVDYELHTIILKQLGANASSVNGETLECGQTKTVQHASTIEIVLSQYPHVVEFDPPPLINPKPPESSQLCVSEKITTVQGNSGSLKRKSSSEDYSRISYTLKDTVDSPPMKNQRVVCSNEKDMNASPIPEALCDIQAHDEWHDVGKEELLIFTKAGCESRSKIAAYDMDGTIITTQSGRVFPKDCDDWKIIYSEVPGKLKQMWRDGFKLVLFTNQHGIGTGKQNVADMKRKINRIIDKLGVPMQVFVSPGATVYRKPRPGMWNYLSKKCNNGISIDMVNSLYVGDAAGRQHSAKKKDHSCADRLFAINVGVPFYTPEEHFLGAKMAPFKMPEFDPRNMVTSSLLEPANTSVPKHEKEVIVLVGSPGCGKTTFASGYLASHNYVQVNRDTLGSWQKCVAVMEKCLRDGHHVVVDNTNPDAVSRKRFIAAAVAMNVPVRCFLMNVTLEQAKHNNKFRELNGSSHTKISDMIYNMYRSKYEEPTTAEGFEEIIRVNFIPRFKTKEEQQLYTMFLLEK